MRSRSLTILLTVSTIRRSTAAGWRFAMICAHCWSIVDLQLVDRRFVGADRVGAPRIVVLFQRVDRARHLLLDDAAHRQHAGADRLHLSVELLVRVVAHFAAALMRL